MMKETTQWLLFWLAVFFLIGLALGEVMTRCTPS